MRHDPPLTLWPKARGVLAATRGGIRYRAEPMGRNYLCTVERAGRSSTPIKRNHATSLAAAVSWLTATAAEIDAGHRPPVRGRITPRGWR